MAWPLKKIYEYMAFYLTESEEFRKKENFKQTEKKLETPEKKHERFLKTLEGLD